MTRSKWKGIALCCICLKPCVLRTDSGPWGKATFSYRCDAKGVSPFSGRKCNGGWRGITKEASEKISCWITGLSKAEFMKRGGYPYPKGTWERYIK